MGLNFTSGIIKGIIISFHDVLDKHQRLNLRHLRASSLTFRAKSLGKCCVFQGVLNFCEGISTTLSVSKSWNERGREEKLPRRSESPPRIINDTPPTVYKGDWKCVKVCSSFWFF